MISRTPAEKAVDWLLAGQARSQGDRVALTASWHAVADAVTDARYHALVQGPMVWWTASTIAAVLVAFVAFASLSRAWLGPNARTSPTSP